MSDYSFDFNMVRGGTPIVTVSAIGLSFNSGARAMLGNPEKIEIGFDEDKSTIGVRAAVPNTSNPTYEFESRVKDNWVRISCKDFMKFLNQRTGLDFLKKAIQFLPVFDSDLNMLLLILDDEHRK